METSTLTWIFIMQLYCHEKSCTAEGSIAFIAHRSEETTIPGQGWTWDLREETLYFNIYVLTGFVRKLEKFRVTTVLRGKLLLVLIQGDFPATFFPMAIFRTTTVVFQNIANDNLHGTPQLKHRNTIHLSFLSSSCQSSVKTDLFGNIPLMTVDYLYRRQIADDFW